MALAAAPLVDVSAFWKSSHRFLTDKEALTLNAVCERIIPADQDPGAAWAGAVEFIDRKLVAYHRRYQSLYREGLGALEASASALFGKPFTELTAMQQDDLLHRIEAGQVPGDAWKRISAGDFFTRVVEHTMEGFYGGPRHGGNRDAISWRMLGLPEPIVRSRRPVRATWAGGTDAGPGKP